LAVVPPGFKRLKKSLTSTKVPPARQSRLVDLGPPRRAALLRAHGLLRTDLDVDTQVYALNAVTTGFYLVEPLMSGQPELDLEVQARAIAQTVRHAFESPEPPDRAVLRTLAPKTIALYEQLREAYRKRVQGDPPREEPS